MAPGSLRAEVAVNQLAESLALAYRTSTVDALTAASLQQLLPHLEFLSVAVTNPAQHGGIVAAANCAQAGPTTLHLHEASTSAAGLALALGQPLQGSLMPPQSAAAELEAWAEASFAAAAEGWTDVREMLAQAPAVGHMLCIPFGRATSSSAGASGDSGSGSSSGAEAQCAVKGSGSGALLFGFSAACTLEARRAALLALLAQCIPAPMEQHSADTLAFVNYACGRGPCSCASCCCPQPDEEEEDIDSLPGGPCRERHWDGGDSGSGAPSLLLRTAALAGAEQGGPDDDVWAAAGPSSAADGLRHRLARDSKAAAAAEAAAASPASSMALTDFSGSRASWSSRTSSFTKSLLASGVLDDDGALQQVPLLLRFRSPQVEREYCRWMSQYHIKVDLTSALLMMAILTTVSLVQPYRRTSCSVATLLLGLGCALPFVLGRLNYGAYTAWRERLVMLLRTYVAVFVMLSFHRHQLPLPLEQPHRWIALWRATGAESLGIAAIGFTVRLQWHLLLQLATVVVAGCGLARRCTQCCAGVEPQECISSSAAMLALAGYVIPTLVLHRIERRSRGIFAAMLRSAAAQY